MGEGNTDTLEQKNQELLSRDISHEDLDDSNREQENQQETSLMSEEALTDDNDEETHGDSRHRARRRRTQRDFPAAPFQEALELALAIQKQSSGQKIRRLTLFELMGRSAESGTSRQLGALQK